MKPYGCGFKQNGQSVPHEQEVACYIHEGDEEPLYLSNHPLSDLEPNTDYYVSVLSSDVHPEPGIDSGQGFRTSTEVLTMDADAPRPSSWGIWIGN